MTSPLLATYVNGGYRVELFSDGTKVRETLDASAPPPLPEQMDLKITDWCDAACSWCHEKSTPRGQHGDVTAMLELLTQLPAGAEIAIGGGDPLSHPEFERLVTGLRAHGLVPSVTVNGKHFARHRDMLERLTSENKLYGVGISYSGEIPDWDYPHMVLHLIAGVHNPDVLDAATRRMKVLLLGYKQFGRGAKHFALREASVQGNLAAWYRELFWVAKEHHVSFDNLAIEQLKPERLFASDAQYSNRYMGQEGMHSMYVDGVTQTFGISSYSSIRNSWSNMRAMFSEVRTQAGFAVAA